MKMRPAADETAAGLAAADGRTVPLDRGKEVMRLIECDWFHEGTLDGIERAFAMALELSMKASPGRWEAEPCPGATELEGPFVVRLLESGGDSSKLTKNDAQFVAAARHGLPSFATAMRSLVSEVRRLQSGKGYEDLLAAVERIAHERNALGRAIADAAKRAGIYNGKAALTGPDLLLLAQNMAEEIERLQQRDRDWQNLTGYDSPDDADESR